MLKDHPKDPYCRYYRIGGVTIQVEADLPLTAETFHPKFKAFEVDGPDEEPITIRHHFHLPLLSGLDLGEEVYLKPPWAIYRKRGGWSYVQISPYRCTSISRLWNRFRCGLPALPGASHEKDGQPGSRTSCLERRWYVHLLAEFDQDHTSGHIYSRSKGFFRKGNHHSLTLFPTDQILLAHVLADRQGCYLHSSGAVLDGSGYLFVGHSGAGKSTVVTMLQHQAHILCDDRVIVRKDPNGLEIHGTWSHGDVPYVSPGSAPLKAILFLKKAHKNRLTPIVDTQDVFSKAPCDCQLVGQDAEPDEDRGLRGPLLHPRIRQERSSRGAP